MDHVTVHGPLFEIRQRVIDAALDDGREAVAQEGINRLHAALGTVLKHPTGAYESRVVDDIAADTNTVTDGGAVYGPWLEGTSSRNTTTRFKGYRTFRTTADQLRADAPGIASGAMLDQLRRLQ